MALFSKRRSKPQVNSPLPPVTMASRGPDLGIGGRRLATLGMIWLKVECDCGHEGRIAVPDLAERHGCQTHARAAVAKLRRSQCGRARFRNITPPT